MSPPEPEKKRRLPVLKESELPPEDDARPPWHWAAIAAVGVFVFWFPLIFAASAVASPGPAWAALNAAAFALASALAGFLVGRFGGKAGKREATVGGGSAGALAWLVAAAQGARAGLLAWVLVLVVIVGMGAGAARAGGALGVARRAKA